jgi:hypothetical protein
MAGTQIFVRNREGKVFGPIEPSTVELLIDGGVLQGLLQVSTDGERYALPYRFPELRDFFPRHLWGDDHRQEVQLDSPPAEGPPAVTLFGTGTQAATTSDLAAGIPADSVASAALPRPAAAPGAPPPTLVSSASAPTLTASAPVARDSAEAARPAVPAAPTASVPAPPVLTAAPSQPLTPGPPPAPGRTPTGTFPAPPVLTAAPSQPLTATLPPRAAGPLQPEDTWAEAVPFELAPPGAPKPPPRAAAPLTSTFSLLRADLAETNALKVYVQGARAGATGLFFFDLEDRTTTLYMRRGNPESAESTHASDAIGPFLVAQRLATPEQVARAEGRRSVRQRRARRALHPRRGQPRLVFPALAQRAADILLRAYLSRRGSFRFEALELPASKVVPLGNRWGLLAEVIRRVPCPSSSPG